MRDLLYLLLGWLLGLLSPLIAEHIRRRYRQEDFVASLVGEFIELQYTMAAVAGKMRLKLGNTTDEFLDWLRPIVQSYDGPGRSQTFAEGLTRLRAFPEQQRREVEAAMRDDSRGVTLKRYEMPFLANQSGELSICPLDLQRRVFHVRARLDLFNQEVGFMQRQYERTFDTSIVGENRDAVERNITEGYGIVGSNAESIARSIGEIISIYGRRSGTS